jgi:putative peptidoglycan lipid II flippase
MIIRSIATIGSFTIMSRVLGFVRDALIAAFLGAGPIADAFIVAFKLPNFFRRLFGEGALNSAFVPMFSRYYASKGLAAATQMAEQIFTVLLVTLLLLVVGVELATPWLMYVIAPGFSVTPERFSYAVEFTRVTFPYILFISLSAFLSGILNSLNRFAASAAAPILLNLVMIAALIGFKDLMATVGHVLVWAVAVSGILQFLWMRYATAKAGVKIRLVKPSLTPAVRQLLKVMLPGALGAGVIQINLFIDIVIASLLPVGGVSYLFYADRLVQLPLSVIGIAMSTALLPVLAKHLQSGKIETAHLTQNRAVEFSLILTLPASMALMILAHPIISMLFERGKFGSYEALQTAYVLAIFASGLPAYIMVKIFSTSFFAKYDTKTPVIAALLGMAVNVILNFSLLVPFKHLGIAFATVVASWVNAGFLFFKLRSTENFSFDERLKEKTPRILLATILMALVLGLSLAGFYEALTSPSFLQWGFLTGLIGLGFSVYLLSAQLLKAFDIKKLIQLFLKSKADQRLANDKKAFI